MGASSPAPKVIRVFAASPGDVGAEREAVDRVILELNDTLQSIRAPVRLEFVRWEVNVRPAAGRPQSSIFKQIGDYDVLIAMMWRRYGSPTGKDSSGTVEEYRRAYARWKRKHRPEIMFYFSNAPAPPPTEVRDAVQLLNVVRFRASIRHQQLIAEYDSVAGFTAAVRRHLNAVIAAHMPVPPASRGRKRKGIEAIAQAADETRKVQFLDELRIDLQSALGPKKRVTRGNGRGSKGAKKPDVDPQVTAVVRLMSRLLRELGKRH